MAGDRLIEQSENGVVVKYAYDADGNLVSRTVDGVTTRFPGGTVGNYSHVLAELDEAGNVTSRYVYADVPVQARRVTGPLRITFRTDKASPGGSPMRAGKSQTDICTMRSAPLTHAGTSVNPLLYTGELADAITGDYYLVLGSTILRAVSS